MSICPSLGWGNLPVNWLQLLSSVREPLKNRELWSLSTCCSLTQSLPRFLYRGSASSSRLPISLGVGDGLDSGWMGRFVQMHSGFITLKKPVLNHSECLTGIAINENCNSHMKIMTLINTTFSVEDWMCQDVLHQKQHDINCSPGYLKRHPIIDILVESLRITKRFWTAIKSRGQGQPLKMENGSLSNISTVSSFSLSLLFKTESSS